MTKVDLMNNETVQVAEFQAEGGQSAPSDERDRHWMSRALTLARQSAECARVPIGAVVVHQDRIVGEGYNQPASATDPTGHAEIMALRAAGSTLGNYRLLDCQLFVTVEPCAMCAGALVHARISQLVFGAREHRAGAVVSHLQLLDQPHFNHRIPWREGVLGEQCGQLMLEFFRARR